MFSIFSNSLFILAESCLNDLTVITDLYAQSPAQADTVKIALSDVERGLGGAIELPGGIWIMLASLAAWQSKRFPLVINIIGTVIGAAGIVTVIPVLYEAGTLFGIGAIVWFIGIGITLLRSRSRDNSTS